MGLCVCVRRYTAHQSYVWQNVSTFNCRLRKNDYTWLSFVCGVLLVLPSFVATMRCDDEEKLCWNSHKFSNQSPHIGTIEYAHCRSYTTPTDGNNICLYRFSARIYCAKCAFVVLHLQHFAARLVCVNTYRGNGWTPRHTDSKFLPILCHHIQRIQNVIAVRPESESSHSAVRCVYAIEYYIQIETNSCC